MTTSPSTTNFENIGMYLKTTYNCPWENRNGKAIRKTFKKPVVVTPKWEVNECIIPIRNAEGVTNTINGFEVTRGSVTNRFITMEAVNKFIVNNK